MDLYLELHQLYCIKLSVCSYSVQYYMTEFVPSDPYVCLNKTKQWPYLTVAEAQLRSYGLAIWKWIQQLLASKRVLAVQLRQIVPLDKWPLLSFRMTLLQHSIMSGLNRDQWGAQPKADNVFRQTMPGNTPNYIPPPGLLGRRCRLWRRRKITYEGDRFKHRRRNQWSFFFDFLYCRSLSGWQAEKTHWYINTVM